MTRTNTLLFSLFALALLTAFTAGPAAAQTPDGETPAVEEICSDYAGASFGLCNAYCEAMDCHLAHDGDDTTQPHASENACLKVKDKFFRLSGYPTLPCHEAVCPVGTEGCPCALGEEQCEGEMFCNEDQFVCSSEGGGDEY